MENYMNKDQPGKEFDFDREVDRLGIRIKDANQT